MKQFSARNSFELAHMCNITKTEHTHWWNRPHNTKSDDDDDYDVRKAWIILKLFKYDFSLFLKVLLPTFWFVQCDCLRKAYSKIELQFEPWLVLILLLSLHHSFVRNSHISAIIWNAYLLLVHKRVEIKCSRILSHILYFIQHNYRYYATRCQTILKEFPFYTCNYIWLKTSSMDFNTDFDSFHSIQIENHGINHFSVFSFFLFVYSTISPSKIRTK